MPADANLDGPALLARAAAIRLPLTLLAAGAGLDKHTVVRLRQRARNVRHRTIARVRAALEREEIKLRDHLIALHGLPTHPALDRAVAKDGPLAGREA